MREGFGWLTACSFLKKTTVMAQKENKGGILKNDQVEEDLQVKGRGDEKGEAYTGSQDTGDKKVRQLGTDVQQADGRPADTENGE
jgi:hypothetical protein